MGQEGAAQALERAPDEPVRRGGEGVLPGRRLRGRNHRRASTILHVPQPAPAEQRNLHYCCAPNITQTVLLTVVQSWLLTV